MASEIQRYNETVVKKIFTENQKNKEFSEKLKK